MSNVTDRTPSGANASSNDFATDAAIADWVYHRADSVQGFSLGEIAPSYVTAPFDRGDLEAHGLLVASDNFIYRASTGFGAAILKSGDTYTIVYRGTDMGLTTDIDLGDLTADVAIGIGHLFVNDQAQDAILLARYVLDNLADGHVSKVHLVGQSLGGGLAGLAAADIGTTASLISPAPFKNYMDDMAVDAAVRQLGISSGYTGLNYTTSYSSNTEILENPTVGQYVYNQFGAATYDEFYTQYKYNLALYNQHIASSAVISVHNANEALTNGIVGTAISIAGAQQFKNYSEIYDFESDQHGVLHSPTLHALQIRSLKEADQDFASLLRGDESLKDVFLDPKFAGIAGVEGKDRSDLLDVSSKIHAFGPDVSAMERLLWKTIDSTSTPLYGYFDTLFSDVMTKGAAETGLSDDSSPLHRGLVFLGLSGLRDVITGTSSVDDVSEKENLYFAGAENKRPFNDRVVMHVSDSTPNGVQNAPDNLRWGVSELNHVIWDEFVEASNVELAEKVFNHKEDEIFGSPGSADPYFPELGKDAVGLDVPWKVVVVQAGEDEKALDYKPEKSSGGSDEKGDVDKSHLIIGGDGNDTLKGSNQQDYILGEKGNDSVSGGKGKDIILGGEGDDTLFGGIEEDTILGGAGVDILDGGKGDSTYHGGAGADLFIIDPEADKITIESVEAADRIILRGSALLTSGEMWGDIGGGGFGDGKDLTPRYDLGLSTSGIELISRDAVFKNPAADFINAWGGRYEDFYIDKGRWADVSAVATETKIDGKEGLKLILYNYGERGHSVTVEIKNWKDGDLGIFKWNEKKNAGMGSGPDGYGQALPNKEIPVPDNYQLGTDSEGGGGGQRRGLGSIPGNDTLVGTDDDDIQYGASGDDQLAGGEGDDQQDGGLGDDTLVGSLGDDAADGGKGADRYDYASGDGSDTIDDTGEASDADVLSLTDLNAQDIALGFDGMDLLVTVLATGETIRVAGQFGTEIYSEWTGSNGIEGIAFADGSTLDRADILEQSGFFPPVEEVNGDDADNILTGDYWHNVINGFDGDDRIAGEAGDDELIGGAGADTVLGGAGDDLVIEADDGADDRLDGGAGADGINYSEATGAVLVDLVAGTAIGTAIGTSIGQDVALNFEGATGGMSADTLLGSASDNWLYGGLGDDELAGRDGDDALVGEAGDDSLEGENGDDSMEGADGEDTLSGGRGDDWLVGGLGSDQYLFELGDGQDTISDWNDSYHGFEDSDFDVLSLGVGIELDDLSFRRAVGGDSVVIDINGGADQIHFRDQLGETHSVEEIRFADGSVVTADQLRDLVLRSQTTSGDDEIYGTSLDDTLEGGAGDDDLRGGAGDDTLEGGLGDDELIGDAGSDLIIYSSGDGDDVIHTEDPDRLRFSDLNVADLTFGRVDGAPRDLVITITSTGEKLLIGDQFDFGSFVGSYGLSQIQFADGTIWSRADIPENAPPPAVVEGSAGPDVIDGTNEDLTFRGGLGADKLNGGSGADTFLYTSGDGNDTISAGGATDTLVLEDLAQADVTFSRDENALIVKVGATGELIRVEVQFPGVSHYRGVETIRFADGTTLDRAQIATLATIKPIIGTSSADYLYLAEENDTIFGMGGHDYISAGSGGDQLIGGAGDDALDGEEGSDEYVIAAGDGDDSIYDTPNSDDDDVDILKLTDIAIADVELTRDADDLIITVSATGQTVRIASQFAASDASYGVEKIHFSDGELASRADIAARTTTPPIVGTAGNDNLYGGALDDTLIGGRGNDELSGGGGSNTYIYASGDGNDRISASGVDTLKFTDLTLADMSFARSETNLVITVNNTGETIIVKMQFYPFFAEEGIERIEFSDGMVLNEAQINALAPIAGTAGAEWLNDTAGDDVIIGHGGDDTLRGGTGSDRFVYARGDGSDLMADLGQIPGHVDILDLTDIPSTDVTFTRVGDDFLIHISGSSDVITVQQQFYQPVVIGIEQIKFADGVVFERSQFQDLVDGGPPETNVVLEGAAGDNALTGGVGADTLKGYAGADTLTGGKGADLVIGNAGDDVYVFNRGDGQDVFRDEYYGGGGFDTIQFGAGITAADLIVSQPEGANDLLIKIAGTTDQITITYGLWADDNRIEQVKFSDGSTLSFADLRAMALTGTSAAELLEGDADANAILGAGGADSLIGHAGADTLTGGAGDDWVVGSAGDDTYVFNLGDGQDVIEENSHTGLGGGSDRIQFGAGVTASDLVFSAPSGGNDLLIQIAGTTDQIAIKDGLVGEVDRVELVRFSDGSTLTYAQMLQNLEPGGGTGGADTLEGDADANILTGGAGDDSLRGYGGADTLTGGAGDDILIGNGGDDTYVFNLGDGQDLVRDEFWGGGGFDTIQFGSGVIASDIVVRQPAGANDMLIQIAGTDDQITIFNGFWNDENRVEQVRFDDGSTLSFADLRARALTGTTASELLEGDADANAILGGGGNDSLIAHGGADTLTGGAGDDWVVGGEGDDVYAFNLGDGQDIVQEKFYGGPGGGQDMILFGAGVTGVDLVLTATSGGNDLLIQIAGTSDQITIKDGLVADTDRIEKFKFADGVIWDQQQINSHLDLI